MEPGNRAINPLLSSHDTGCSRGSLGSTPVSALEALALQPSCPQASSCIFLLGFPLNYSLLFLSKSFSCGHFLLQLYPLLGFLAPFFEQEFRPRLPGDTVLLLQPAYSKVPGQSNWQYKERSFDVCREQGLICCPFPPDLDPTCLCTFQDLCVAQGTQTGCRDSTWQEEQDLGQRDR